MQRKACIRYAAPEEPAELADPEHELPLHFGYACFWSNFKTAQAPDCSRVVPHILPVKALHLHVLGLVSVKTGFVRLTGKSDALCQGLWIGSEAACMHAPGLLVKDNAGKSHLACAQHIPD